MKVKIGDIVRWVDSSDTGPVIAMTNDWCIFISGENEIAVPWVRIELVAFPGDKETLLIEKEFLK